MPENGASVAALRRHRGGRPSPPAGSAGLAPSPPPPPGPLTVEAGGAPAHQAAAAAAAGSTDQPLSKPALFLPAPTPPAPCRPATASPAPPARRQRAPPLRHSQGPRDRIRCTATLPHEPKPLDTETIAPTREDLEKNNYFNKALHALSRI
ncbi:Protein of unknown function [Gryllus bimaculatus]|nr:Protein of unknown function [Gryllus bimaculatus]